MDELGRKGIISGPQIGYLDLTMDALKEIVCTESITDHYDVEQTPFARGKFAAVRRVRCTQSGIMYAAKVVRKRRRARDVRYETLHEAAVLALARDQDRIVNLHKVYEGPSEMILVLELASGGELQRVIDEEERIAETEVKRLMLQILQALAFLHSHNIAHLDIKPQNVLLTGPHPGSDVMLCDFGIARVILSDIEVREVVGTPDYVAPEILQYEPISLATDMWSVGVLAYVSLSGHSPFGGDTKQETFLNISQCVLDFPDDLFEGVTSQAIDLISKLLIVEPCLRLTVQEAINSEWLRSSGQQQSETLTLPPLGNPTPCSLLNNNNNNNNNLLINPQVIHKENNKNLVNSSIHNKVESTVISPLEKTTAFVQHENNNTHRTHVEVCLSQPITSATSSYKSKPLSHVSHPVAQKHRLSQPSTTNNNFPRNNSLVNNNNNSYSTIINNNNTLCSTGNSDMLGLSSEVSPSKPKHLSPRIGRVSQKIRNIEMQLTPQTHRDNYSTLHRQKEYSEIQAQKQFERSAKSPNRSIEARTLRHSSKHTTPLQENKALSKFGVRSIAHTVSNSTSSKTSSKMTKNKNNSNVISGTNNNSTHHQINFDSSNRKEAVRRVNLNRSFGSIDKTENRERRKVQTKFSPLCLRREGNKCDPSSPKDNKFTQRKNFQGILLKKGLIY